MNLKEFEYSYETSFDYANPAHKTISYGIDLLRCSPERMERVLDGKTILEKLLELRETSEYISNMDTEYCGSHTIEGSVTFHMNDKTQCKVTVSHDDFMDFAEIVNTLEGL